MKTYFVPTNLKCGCWPGPSYPFTHHIHYTSQRSRVFRNLHVNISRVLQLYDGEKAQKVSCLIFAQKITPIPKFGHSTGMVVANGIAKAGLSYR